VYAVPDRLLRDRERCLLLLVVLQPDNRISFVTQVHKVAVIDPLSLQELHRGHRLGAKKYEVDPMREFIIVLCGRIRIIGRSVGCAATDDAMEVHVRELRQAGIARIHAPHVGAERHLPAMGIVGVSEVVVALGVFAERRVVMLWRKG
jgi:hypothetical protein